MKWTQKFKRLLLVSFGLFPKLTTWLETGMAQGDNHEVMRLEELPAKFHLGQLLLESQPPSFFGLLDSSTSMELEAADTSIAAALLLGWHSIKVEENSQFCWRRLKPMPETSSLYPSVNHETIYHED